MSIFIFGNINSLIKGKKYSKLKKLLSSHNETVRYKTFLSLSHHVDDPEIEKLLTPFIEDSDCRVRTLAMIKFADSRAKENLGNLDNIFSLGTPAEKMEILKIVAENETILHDDLTPFMVTALSDKYDLVVIKALKLAVELKNSIVFEAVIARLHNKKHIIRCEVAKTLGEYGDDQSVDALIGLLIDIDPQVRLTAKEILTQLSSSKNLKSKILESIQNSKFALIAANLSGSMQNKIKALKEIQTHKLDFTAPMVEKLLSDKYKLVRLEAVKTLGILSKPETIPAIVRLLEDQFGDVRVEAVLALGKCAGKKSLEYLDLVQNDKNKNMKMAVKSIKARFAKLENK